ncbi:MAG TPA: hypothetical protein VLL76_11105 [Candidatus Omnitrophota bacterium]|nr:hypothetical protein [Candidatus Omnitrophota bacterium]
MKKSLVTGVSAAAMLFAFSAQASGLIGQKQGFALENNQGQTQGMKTLADGGNASAKASGGDAGGGGHPGNHNNDGPYSMSYGGKSGGGDGGYAKAYGEGGDAYAKGYQDQGQEQSLVGHQEQVVVLPDITVNVPAPTPSSGGGGAAGPRGDGDSNTVSGENNRNLSHNAEDDAIIADRGARVARQIEGTAILGDNVNLDSFNVTMNNVTDMSATNTVGPISLDSGNANGGRLYGGDNDIDLDADVETEGNAGDADANIGSTTGGRGGNGGNGTAVTANVGLQSAKSKNKTEGGDGSAYSKAYGASVALSAAKSGAKSYSKNYGKSENDVEADAEAAPGNGGGWNAPSLRSGSHHKRGSGDALAKADAGGESSLFQKAKSNSEAGAWGKSNATTKQNPQANAAGGAAGAIDSKTGNMLDQEGKAMAAGGDGAAGGDAKAMSMAKGGDNAQMASSKQTVNAATGATTGANGGSVSVAFGTGSIGAISLGTVHGIASVAQNSGLSANQFTAFSINAHTNF